MKTLLTEKCINIFLINFQKQINLISYCHCEVPFKLRIHSCKLSLFSLCFLFHSLEKCTNGIHKFFFSQMFSLYYLNDVYKWDLLICAWDDKYLLSKVHGVHLQNLQFGNGLVITSFNRLTWYLVFQDSFQGIIQPTLQI
jgi:hypothetical protein